MRRLTPLAIVALASLLLAAAPTTKTIVVPNGTTYSGQGVDLYDVLQSYARHAHINLYIDPSTPHTPQTFIMQNVSDRAALEALVRNNGLAMRESNGILFVAPPTILAAHFAADGITSASIPVGAQAQQLAQTIAPLLPIGTSVVPQDQVVFVVGTPDAVRAARDLLGGAGAPILKSYHPVSREAADLVDSYSKAFPYGPPDTLIAERDTNLVLVRGTPTFVDSALADLALLDVPVPQVFYDISIIEIEPKAYDLNRGVLFGGADAQGQQNAGNFSTVTTLKNRSLPFNLTINEMEQQGSARVLRRPSVSARNGEETSMQQTQNIPYSVPNSLTGIPTIQTLTTGVILNATPTVIGGTIHTKLDGSYTVETGIGAQGIPETETNAISGSFDTLPDEQIVISGLYADDDSDTVTGLPGLDHWWLIGGLLRNHQEHRQHVEVVITMQAHLDTPGNRHLPVAFPAIDPALIRSGIAPAPTASPTTKP